MKFLIAAIVLSTAFGATKGDLAEPRATKQAIDFGGFLELAKKVEPFRKQRRISEQQFLEMAREKGTIVLDTRSAAAFEQLHVAGAVHVNFSDITKERLVEAIPNKKTRVLIYCNNNFRNNAKAFPAKRVTAALNIPTFITLYDYGYRNLYELGPVIDAEKSELPLVSSADEQRAVLRTLAVPK